MAVNASIRKPPEPQHASITRSWRSLVTCKSARRVIIFTTERGVKNCPRSRPRIVAFRNVSKSLPFRSSSMPNKSMCCNLRTTSVTVSGLRSRSSSLRKIRFLRRSPMSFSISFLSRMNISLTGFVIPSTSLCSIQWVENVTRLLGSMTVLTSFSNRCRVTLLWRMFLSAHSLTNMSFTNAWNAGPGPYPSDFHIALWQVANIWRARDVVGRSNLKLDASAPSGSATEVEIFNAPMTVFRCSYFGLPQVKSEKSSSRSGSSLSHS